MVKFVGSQASPGAEKILGDSESRPTRFTCGPCIFGGAPANHCLSGRRLRGKLWVKTDRISPKRCQYIYILYMHVYVFILYGYSTTKTKKHVTWKKGPISKGKDGLPSIHCSGDMLCLCGVIHKYKSIYLSHFMLMQIYMYNPLTLDDTQPSEYMANGFHGDGTRNT